ncbi:hypothetical protein HDV04_000775 [Boothiomyces sp. JEL0838]|nr:hypothetical protein HDV04_000775 [Boothiomyces sp. JEL0838]
MCVFSPERTRQPTAKLRAEDKAIREQSPQAQLQQFRIEKTRTVIVANYANQRTGKEAVSSGPWLSTGFAVQEISSCDFWNDRGVLQRIGENILAASICFVCKWGSIHTSPSATQRKIKFSRCTILYYKLALRHARLAGINDERKLAKITLFDYERENIRRLWWVLYRDYSSFPKILVDSSIEDCENQLFLPSNKFLFESPTHIDYYGIEVMTSNEWYTCSIPDLDIEAYHSILQRIQLKTSRYTDMVLSGTSNDSLYIAGCINASLKEWRLSFLPKSKYYFKVITSRQNKDRDRAWFTVYIALLFYSVRINLVLPTFMRNVINGKDVTRQLYFKEALEAAIACSQLIDLISVFNPLLEYFEVVALLKLFPPTFFLLCCSKLHIEGAEKQFKMMIEGIKKFSVAFQKLNQFHNLLLHMESMDLLEAVIYYGIFLGRQKEEQVERPAVSQEELVRNMMQIRLE